MPLRTISTLRRMLLILGATAALASGCSGGDKDPAAFCEQVGQLDLVTESESEDPAVFLAALEELRELAPTADVADALERLSATLSEVVGADRNDPAALERALTALSSQDMTTANQVFVDYVDSACGIDIS